MESVKLTIDGQQVTARPGASVLETALENGIYIPHLCHHPDLPPGGVCRLCMVEIEGRGQTIGCRAPVADGMVVRTSGPGIDQARRVALELLLVNHPTDCLSCSRNNNCELQRAAAYIGVDEGRLARLRRPELTQTLDTSNPFFTFDPNKCVLCGLCVRTCDELQNIGAIDFAHRGFTTKVSPFAGKSFLESRCVSCGECVARCPVGALAPKHFQQPTREVQTICPYCGVGCSLYLGVRGDRIVSVRGDRDHPVNKGNLCVKGRFGQDFVNSPDRLTHPLIKENGAFREASWDEALNLVAERLTRIKADHGPRSLAVLSSAKCSNEDNYVLQKFARGVLGTNNVDHCARLCHSSTVAGLAAAFGSGAMTNSIAEIEHADVIYITGSNTTENHPVLSLYVKRAVRERGAKLIVADPRRIPITEFAHIHMRQACGTDVALFNGLMHVIVKEGLHDAAFIRERTEGFQAFADGLDRYTPEHVSGITGVPADDIVETARLFGSADRATILFAMGITQHATGTDNVLSAANLALLTGNVGKPSSGVNPLRGQNNVQGACDMGALPNVYPGYQSVTDPEARQRFEAAWDTTLDDQVGLTVVEMMDGAADGTVKGMYFMGENPVLSDPDSTHIREALEKVDFLVVQDIFLTETAEYADVVLPAASYAEKDGTVTNTERRVQRMHRALPPVGTAREDWRIVCDVARRAGTDMGYESADEILDEIASVTPIYGGILPDRLNGHGLQWPCPSREHPGTPFLHSGKFTRGLGKFTPVEHRDPAEMVDDEFPLVLTTGRQLYHFHTIMTRKVPGLNVMSPEATVEMHPADASRLGIQDRGLTRVTSRRGSVVAAAEVTDTPPVGTVFMTFHFGEAAANILTNPVLDPVSKIPEFKVCAVRVAPESQNV